MSTCEVDPSTNEMPRSVAAPAVAGALPGLAKDLLPSSLGPCASSSSGKTKAAIKKTNLDHLLRGLLQRIRNRSFALFFNADLL
jgi:hypothetical protein